MEIANLSNHKHFIPTIIDFIWDEWSHDYETLTDYKTKEDLFNFYYSLNSTDDVPTAYVLFNQDQFICTCLVDKEDMGVHVHLSPWLANVFTHPSYRNKGYAKLLIQYIISKYPTLYLWTFNQKLADYYKQFGFQEKETIPKHGDLENIIVMLRLPS